MPLAGPPSRLVPSGACLGSTSAWRASSFSLRRDPCCGPGWAFRTGSSVWQHRQVAISEASLPMAVPIALQEPAQIVPMGGALFRFGSEGGRSPLAGPAHVAAGSADVGAVMRPIPCRTRCRFLVHAPHEPGARQFGRSVGPCACQAGAAPSRCSSHEGCAQEVVISLYS